MKHQWKQGSFYTLESQPGCTGGPVMRATITQPAATCAIELLISVADFPLIGAPFEENEMDKAKEIGEMLVERFWPSEEAVQAITFAGAMSDEQIEEGTQ